jgi:hypothetical protein
MFGRSPAATADYHRDVEFQRAFRERRRLEHEDVALALFLIPTAGRSLGLILRTDCFEPFTVRHNHIQISVDASVHWKY